MTIFGNWVDVIRKVFASGVEAKDLIEFFGRDLVSPVLVAHPTEVRRKSVLNCQMVIARLLDERERM